MREELVQRAGLTSTQPQLPATSLTICSRNRPELLLETVKSVLRGLVLPTEIVVVDQSDEPHPTLAGLKPDRSCEICYLWQQAVGVGRARNAAINAARYDILVLTDDDMLAAPAWYGSLILALLEAGPRSVVTGQVRPSASQTTGGFAPSTKVDRKSAIYEGRVGQDVLYTGNAAMYRTAIDEIGMFDERLGAGAHFPAAYDNDFGFRLLEAGYCIRYTPEAVLYHQAWRSERDYGRLQWAYGRGQGAYYAKHLSLRDLYMMRRMVWDIGKSLFYRFPKSLWRQRDLARGDLIYALGLLSGASEWLLTQRSTQ